MAKQSNRRASTVLMAGVAASAIASLAATTPAMAQAAADAAKSSEVEAVVVHAQRRSENIQNVPVSVQAFTAKTIQTLGIKSSVDVGQFTPNVDIALPAGPGNQPIIAIRGIGLNDYDTNNAGPNGVYVDEVYLSAPASQTFQTFDLEQIEVLKGPQGTLYGRNTSGGAINFVTAKPTDQITGDAHIEYSSFDTFHFEGAVGGPWLPNLDGRVAVVTTQSGGYMHNALDNGHENGLNNFAARLELLYKPSDDLKILFNIHGGMVDNRVTEYRHIGDLDANGALCSVSDSYGGKCADIFGYGTPKGFYDGSFNRNQHLKVNSLGSYLRADYNWNGITFTSLTGFEHNDKIHPEDSDASPNRLLEINFGVKSNTTSQEFRATQTTKTYNWTVGAYYLHEDLYQDQPIFLLLDADKFFGGPGSGDGIAFQAFDNSHQVTDAYAVFGQGSYTFFDKLTATLGGRYTGEQRSFQYLGSVQFQQGGMDNFGPLQQVANASESLTSDAFSYRAALDYRVMSDILAYGSIATGYKSGDFNGSFLSLDPTQIARQLQPVKPERVTAYEIGLKTSWFDHRLIANAAAFYNDYSDLQIFELVPVNGIGVNVLSNAESAHTQGIELQLTARPVSALTISTQMGWLNTRLDKVALDPALNPVSLVGKQLPVSPHFSLAALVDYKVPIGEDSLDFQYSASYRTHQYFDITNDPYTTQSAYWLQNVRIAYGFDHGHWEVAGFIHNLEDQHYYLDSFDLSFVGFIQGIVGTPRTFGVELNYKY
jgi:iron complex outermembrane recepter protein